MEIRTTPSATPADDFARGEAHYRAGEFDAAAAIFERLRAARPDDPNPIRLLGLCLLRRNDVTAALDLLAKAHALAPADPYARLHYGLGLHAAGRHREAAAQFDACTSLLPDDPAPSLNLSAALLALGDNQAAFDAALRARQCAPALPQAVYMVGLALLALGRLEAAEEAFAATIQLAPAFADAWVNLGIVRYRRDDIERAKLAMQRVLAVMPGHIAAAANLGAFLRLSGQVEAGENLLASVLARNPAAVEARLNLAAALLHEERTDEALALLGAQPVPHEAHLSRHWYLLQALGLLQAGRAEEARAALVQIGDPPADMLPLVLWRRVLLALADGDAAGARAQAQEMEKALTNPGLLPEHGIMGHFDLAKFWSRLREHRRAFPHWAEGHRLLRRFQPFSRQAYRDYIDATIAALDRARLTDGPRARNRDPAPVFIVGMPRSGTTLAEQIIGAHPHAFGAGERMALGRAFAALGGADTPDSVARIAALEQPALDAAAENYLAELHALAPGAARIIDKMPGNFAYLGLAALMLPGARIIHCVRDPRDIGLSIFTFRFFGNHPYAHDLGDLGWYITQHDKLMSHWRQAVPNPVFTLQLKDWVEDFDGTLRRVLTFLDLPYDAACERFHEGESRVRTVSRTQVRRPVNNQGLGRWRVYEQELQPLIAELDRQD